MLNEILGVKEEIRQKHEEITKLMEEHGINALITEVKDLEIVKEKMIADSLAAGIMEEGTFRLITTGRRMRELRSSDVRIRYPAIFEQYAKITITAVSNALVDDFLNKGNTKKDAKQMAESIIEDMSDVKEPTSWDVIDLAGG
jgi:hypothetical protein